MKPVATFDYGKHEYQIYGRRVPSVTQILDDVVPGWHAPDYYLALGRANHACYSMLGRGESFSCDPACDPYVATWRQWQIENKVNVLSVECRVTSDLLQYAGCLDAIAEVGDFGPVLIDYKSHVTVPVRWQLSAYDLAIGKQLKIRLAVEIRPDGYKMQWRKGREAERDNQEWLAILTAYRCRRLAGIKDRREEK